MLKPGGAQGACTGLEPACPRDGRSRDAQKAAGAPSQFAWTSSLNQIATAVFLGKEACQRLRRLPRTIPSTPKPLQPLSRRLRPSRFPMCIPVKDTWRKALLPSTPRDQAGRRTLSPAQKLRCDGPETSSSAPQPQAQPTTLAGLPQAEGGHRRRHVGRQGRLPLAGPLAERQAESPAMERIGDKGSFLKHGHGQEAKAQARLRT